MPCPTFWSAEVSIHGARGIGGALRVPDPVRGAVEGALRSGRANGIRFPHSRLRFPWGSPTFVVSEEELACILPTAGCGVTSLDDTGPVAGPALPLGWSRMGRVIGPSVEPDQGRHMAILGETGMGKSSTLVSVSRHATHLGGVVLFDPLGETARSFLAGLPPRERADVVEVSPLRAASAINALEGIGGAGVDPVLADRRLNDIVHALRRVRSGRYTDSGYWGPRLEEMLTRAIAAAAALPSGTLGDAHTLLATGGRTHQVVPAEARDAVRALADRVRERPEDAEGARRLLYEVVRSPVLERMLCERNPPLHTKELVEGRRVVVISGEAARVGESVARYLLAVYLALIWSELLARPGSEKTFVVLDESQWFSHESLAEMLRLARRRNVHVILATQTIASLPETVADAVWTNVSDFVAFRGSPEEARELGRACQGLEVEDLLALPRGQAAVLLGKGNALEWLRTTGRPAMEEPTPPPSEVGENDDARDLPEVRGNPGAAAEVEAVLDWIRERARAEPSGTPVEVPLAAVRDSVDPSGQGTRAAGALLGRAGAIVNRGRTNGAPFWVIDPARLPPAPGRRDDSPDRAAAGDPPPS